MLCGHHAACCVALCRYTWTQEECSVQVEVDADGHVALIHTDTTQLVFQPQSGSSFRVRWEGGRFPASDGGSCAGTGKCAISGSKCWCTARVETTAPFTDTTAVPTAAEIEATLFLGSPPPDEFDEATYVLCESDACSADPTVTVHTHASAAGAFDERTVFSVPTNHTGGRRYLRNKVSTVSIGSYRFRNPVGFMDVTDLAQRDAIHEVRTGPLRAPSHTGPLACLPT
jgi:hypothetical protein